MARRRFFAIPPATTSTDLSVTRPDPGMVKRTTRWEQRLNERAEGNREALALLGQIEAHMGGLFTLAKATPVNDVLVHASYIVGPTGLFKLEWPSRTSAVTLGNPSTAMLAVGQAPAPPGSNPAVGAGVVRVNPGMQRTWNTRGDGISIYAPPGTPFDLTAYMRPRPPASSPIGVGHGGVLLAPGQTTSQKVNNYGGGLGHIAVVLNVSAVAGGSVTLTINGITPSGYVYPLLNALAVTAVSVTPYRIGPSFTPSPNAVADDLVPPLIQVVATVTGTITYGVDLVSGT
jgi:hypothetical protein